MATGLACLLLLQMAIAGGVAVAAEAPSGAILCVTQTTSATSDQSAPAHDGRRHGLCCILHGAALDIPSSSRATATGLLLPRVENIRPVLADAPPLRRLEPKGAPQSPRPPPVATRLS